MVLVGRGAEGLLRYGETEIYLVSLETKGTYYTPPPKREQNEEELVENMSPEYWVNGLGRPGMGLLRESFKNWEESGRSGDCKGQVKSLIYQHKHISTRYNHTNVPIAQ